MLQEPTSLGYGLELVARTLEEDYGVDPAPIFKAIGLERSDLMDVSRRIGNSTYHAMWDAAGQLCEDPALGVKAGLRTLAKHLGVVGHAWLSSATLADALERLVRYEELLDSGVTDITFEKQGDEYVLSEAYPNPADYHGKLGADMGFAAVIALCRVATDRPIKALRAEFLLGPDDHLDIYGETVEGAVTRSEKHNALYFAAADLEQRLPGADADVADAMSRIAERQTQSIDRSKVTHQVRESLIRLLPSGTASQDTVAGQLYRSASTLQRQLKAEGTTYREVSDGVRQSLAESYLREGVHTHAQIAFMTGFGDQSNFARAFKRWTGLSPGAFQRNALKS